VTGPTANHIDDLDKRITAKNGINMITDYIKYYDLENYVLTDVRDKFYRDRYLTAFDFFCIVIWKANRAKTTFKT